MMEVRVRQIPSHAPCLRPASPQHHAEFRKATSCLRISPPDLMSFPKDEWCVLSDNTALSRLLFVSVPPLSAAAHTQTHSEGEGGR